MTINFRNVEAANLKGKKAEIELYELAALKGRPKPVLILQPTSSENAEYFNALLKKHGKAVRGGQQLKASRELLDQSRDSVRELFPLYVVVGWRDMPDGEGVEVPFSLENAQELFRVLPPHMLDRIRNFADEPMSFIEGEAIDAEAIAGNLPTV